MKSRARKLVPDGIDEQFVLVDGHRIRYLAGGSGPSLLLVHGLMGYSFSWSEILPELSKHFRVYAPDMLNLGFSARANVDAHLSAVADRMLRFMDVLNIGDSVALGSSHGGTVAMQMAVNAPHRIKRLVLVSPAHPASETSRWQIKLFSSFLGSPIAFAMTFLPELYMAYGIRRLYADPRRIRQGTISGYSRPLRDWASLRYLLKAARAWNEDFKMLEAQLPSLASIPTELIWGDRDKLVSLESARKLQQLLPSSRLHVVHGSGHLPYEEDPEQFLQVLSGCIANQQVSCA
jgi:pimeloyl-ACP methyl ester carboxylesterase